MTAKQDAFRNALTVESSKSQTRNLEPDRLFSTAMKCFERKIERKCRKSLCLGAETFSLRGWDMYAG